MRLLFYDIEATNLNADFGIMLCVGYWEWEITDKRVKKLGKPTVLRIDQYDSYDKDRTNDKAMLLDFVKVWDRADAVVSWYGGESRYDRPFIRSRMAYHRIKRDLAPIHDIDLWWTARKRFKLTNNRLNTVQEFLDLPSAKTPIKRRHWIRAMAGYKESLDYVVKHCYADVKVLAQAYEVMRPYVPSHPNYNQESAPYYRGQKPRCHRCASTIVHRRGYRTTQAGRMIRYMCQACGGWSKAPVTKSNDLRSI